jgi:hypothetical protein
MQYLLMICANEERVRSLSQGELGDVMSAYMAYTEAMEKAGVRLGSNRLQNIATAHTVRMKDGKTEVLNGPYAETREQLGGYYLIDVPDLASAQSWAARCPGARFGAIEVRPIWTM